MISRQPTPVSEVLKTVFTQLDAEKKPKKEDMDSLWREAAGEEAFRHSRPVAFKNACLTVRVDSSAWMQALSLRSRIVLKGLKRALGKDKISKIQFRIGDFNA